MIRMVNVERESNNLKSGYQDKVKRQDTTFSSGSDGSCYVCNQFNIISEYMDVIRKNLADVGMSSSVPSHVHIDRNEILSHFYICTVTFPAVEGHAFEFLSLPKFPGLTEQELLHIFEAVDNA